jgi:hypothetical protein
MKSGMNSRRGRGRGNGKSRHGGPRSQQLDSSGPDIRIRGTPNQLFDRYLALAREAALAGDSIAAENYFQHAEHYYRLLNVNGMNGNAGPVDRNRAKDSQPGPNVPNGGSPSAQ